ncbi:MAG: hypothetical protein FJ257_07730 [Phycisphaerae bacterium]|nr:hypothetical protein [Phycisphaerae bacterium]
MTWSRTHALVVAALLAAGGCGAPAPIRDPEAVIADPRATARDQLRAMNQLDATPEAPEYLEALRRPINLDGYALDVRKAAFERLYEHDRAQLAKQLALTLPKQDPGPWRDWACTRIGELDWKEMTPTLIRVWAAPRLPWVDAKTPRPEALALERMYGADRVAAVLLRELVEADPLVQANLRMRCWELLLALGQESTLRELVSDGSIGQNDPMLRAIRRFVAELGTLPRNRDEILWAESIGRSGQTAFLEEAKQGITLLAPARRERLRMRDLHVVVAAAKVEPSLLSSSDEELLARLKERLKERQAGRHSPSFEGYGPADAFSETLSGQRDKIDWSDLVALHLALDAIDSPPLAAHLFDFAERDQLDRTTEFGGLIDVDAQGRFRLVEFKPRSRGGDLRYETPTELMQALATGLFHVHLHAQKFENRDYAGPHLGDFQFADSCGLHCLVFTFIDSRTLNCDWYRQDRCVVDLGVVKRPTG